MATQIAKADVGLISADPWIRVMAPTAGSAGIGFGGTVQKQRPHSSFHTTRLRHVLAAVADNAK